MEKESIKRDWEGKKERYEAKVYELRKKKRSR